MKILAFGGYLGLGGTEKAACRWAIGLKLRGHDIHVLAMREGPRAEELNRAGIGVSSCAWDFASVARIIATQKPDVIHMHSSGSPFAGDLIGEVVRQQPRIPVVQTNIFGRLENPGEDSWTDLRLFVSWTSCVQAARRSFKKLDDKFFRRASVVVNPLDPDDGPDTAVVEEFRHRHGIQPGEVVFGHLGRPDPIRWDPLPIAAFRRALQKNNRIKLLLREPPPEITSALRSGPDAQHFLVLPVTADQEELRLTTAAMDVVLHYSKVGESFGYGIAEPMNLGKPAIVNSTPWQGQAQIELARPGECGLVASTLPAMSAAITKLAADADFRESLGTQARRHIRLLTDPDNSIRRLETLLQAAVAGQTNPYAAADLARAREAARYLDTHQFGQTWGEQLALRPLHYRVRFHDFRKSFLGRL